MDPIRPINPVTPSWPSLAVSHPYQQGWQDAAPPRPTLPGTGDETVPVFPYPPPLALPVSAPTLRQVLLDAGVRGLGPVGWGYELSPRELAAALHDAYRHIARSLYHALIEQPSLGRAIGTALAADPRGEGEVGLLMLSDERLSRSLGDLYNPGVTNRWRHTGERLQRTFAEAPKSIVGDLQLVEPPGRHRLP